MTDGTQGNQDNGNRFATLLNNAGAVQAICAAVEGTLGPKGLDTMLVGSGGDVLITNDGVTILEQMDVSHPAARLLVQVARSQQAEVGDGTTTATVLAGALVSEGVAQVIKGVPVAKVVAGLQDGVRLAAERLQAHARPVTGMDDPVLGRIAHVAGREHRDLADLVVRAAAQVGAEKLREDGFRLADCVAASEKGSGEIWPGLIIAKTPLHPQAPLPEGASGVLALMDALEPEKLNEEALGTDAGFQAFLERKRLFQEDLAKLAGLGIALIATDRGVDPEAEQFCADHGIMVLPRLPRADMARLCEFTGARPVRRNALQKAAGELAAFLGSAGRVAYDERHGRVRLAEGGGAPAVTVVVGGRTREVAGERERIARDAAAAVQAAVRGGYVPGGGAVEVAVAHELERYRETVKGMESFGVGAVAQALRKPLAQMAVNAGFNPLEKVEEVKAAQVARGLDSLGIDCDTGQLIDLLEAEIVDPADVKIHAIQTAGEVAAAVLRIHTVIKMKREQTEEAE